MVQVHVGPQVADLDKSPRSSYRRSDGGHLSKRLPPVDFGYTEPAVQDSVEYVDPESLANLPVGLDGSRYRWIDLHGKGIPGILTEQAGAWYYKRNLSPLPPPVADESEPGGARFAPTETVARLPNVRLVDGVELMDLAGAREYFETGPAPIAS